MSFLRTNIDGLDTRLVETIQNNELEKFRLDTFNLACDIKSLTNNVKLTKLCITYLVAGSDSLFHSHINIFLLLLGQQ